MTLPLRGGRGGGMDEPAPRRKHSERQVGETYADALSRVAGERDAARRDVARLQAELTECASRLAVELAAKRGIR
jgi:hypothetical protein